MKLVRVVILGFLLAVASLVAVAQTPAEQLKALLAPIKTLQANFKQTTTSETAEFVATASGVVKIVRPGQFYWQVNQPGKQIIVINHAKLWLYDVDLDQVTIKKLGRSAMALNPASLLSGKLDQLLQRNAVTASAGALTLTPKSAGGTTQWIKLLFHGKQLTGLQFTNQLSQLTTIQFTQLKINQPVNEQLFNLKIPKSADIVNQ